MGLQSNTSKPGLTQGVDHSHQDSARHGDEKQLEAIHAERGNLEEFDPSSLEDARKRVFTAIVMRQGQGQFRCELLTAYQCKCAITACDVLEALEAAHIVSYLGPDTNHVTNGLLLRADIHTLFDLHLISVNPESLCVTISKKLSGTAYEQLAEQSIGLPVDSAKRPNLHGLETRHEEFLAKELDR
jgi:predicted restriction endonuclease